jgi:hypothetical protein
MTKKQVDTKTVNKTVYFNPAIKEDKELLQYLEMYAKRNVSGFLKTILRDFMINHNEGEQIPSPFFVSNPYTKEPEAQEYKMDSSSNGKTITIKISVD